MKTGFAIFTSLGLAWAFIGCSEQSSTTGISDQKEHHSDHDHDHRGRPGKIESPVAPSTEGEKFVLSEAPSNAQDVIAARESVANEQDVALVGRIGGSENPWIEGRAIFTIMDTSIQSCERIEGDNCPTPWDYCCRTDKVPNSSALIKVVDESGKPIKTDARKLLGVRELTEVVIKGKAQRDDAGNLTVLATGVYVKND